MICLKIRRESIFTGSGVEAGFRSPPRNILPYLQEIWYMPRHHKSKSGVLVRSVSRHSPFYRAGLRRGDRVVAINGERIESELDFHFFAAEERLHLDVERGGKRPAIEVKRVEGMASGVTLAEQPIRRCANRCIFCFIDQMPRGLRRSLYIKDEDVRLSLLNGNYVTLSAFRQRDLEHIVRIGLSPLYLSVHATDTQLRRRMLGNPKTPDCMQQLAFLARHGIRFHTQIVVCPSYNDGNVLERTARDLLTFGEAVRSIAVVPVGLTRFRTFPLPPVDHRVAGTVCRSITRLSDRAVKHDGCRKLFLADEFFIKARLPIPHHSYYEEYPQIENGVGLVRRLIDSWQKLKNHPRRRGGHRDTYPTRRLLVTSVSAAPFMLSIAGEMNMLRPAVQIDAVPVENCFFGETVTVAGLLTAIDIIRRVKTVLKQTHYDDVVVPGVIFNHAGYTLDGFSLRRINKALGIPVNAAQSLEGLIDS